MPDRALQMPFRREEAAKVGKNVFRKQILPVGTIEYEGRTLDFSKDYLQGLANNFNAGAFDQVPFQLANDANEHNFDPEKYRGEVKALELADDGLYGLVEMTDEGAEVVSKNPKLGVSARIVEGLEKGSETIGNALQHVLGTLDPKVTGMKPWEAVNLSGGSAGVVDLTDASFSDPVKDGLSDAEQKQLAALARKGGKDAVTSALKDSDLSDEEAAKIVNDLIEDATSEETTETSETKEPVAALSQKDRDAIELAKSDAADAKREAKQAREDLAEERYIAKRDKLVEAGVPPVLVDLAEPVLRGGAGVIELSNGTKVDAHNVVDKMLNECKGFIDLTTVGVGSGGEGSQEAEAKAAAEKWAKQNGGGE